jgi:hypothetical protein
MNIRSKMRERESEREKEILLQKAVEAERERMLVEENYQ